MVFLLAMGLLISAVSMAQELSEIESIMKLSGATSPDELDAYEMERLAGYLDKPILINSSSLEQLISILPPEQQSRYETLQMVMQVINQV